MRLLMAFVFLFYSSVLFAQSQGSVRIDPITIDGKLKFGVQYMADFLNLTASVNTTDIVSNEGAKLEGYLIKKGSQDQNSSSIFLRSIQPQTPSGSTYVIQMGFRGSEAENLKKRLSSMLIELAVYSFDGTTSAVYLDLGGLCLTHPNQFLNIETGETGCP